MLSVYSCERYLSVFDSFKSLLFYCVNPFLCELASVFDLCSHISLCFGGRYFPIYFTLTYLTAKSEFFSLLLILFLTLNIPLLFTLNVLQILLF